MTTILSASGRLGNDPREHTTQSGTAMATTTLAVTLDARGNDEGVTWWLSLVAFNKQAEILLRHAKGDLVAVFGRLQVSQWEGKDGKTHEQHQLIIDELASARSARTGPVGRQPRRVRETQPDFNDEIPF